MYCTHSFHYEQYLTIINSKIIITGIKKTYMGQIDIYNDTEVADHSIRSKGQIACLVR